MTRTKQATPKFENRVRFNWGFHDGVSDQHHGWTRVDGLTIDDIVVLHFDKPYAIGYVAGWCEANGGASDATSSQGAWDAAVDLGNVTE